MSEEQLKENIAHLRSELDHEREERNYFQLERDKINTFWEISKKELEDRNDNAMKSHSKRNGRTVGQRET